MTHVALLIGVLLLVQEPARCLCVCRTPALVPLARDLIALLFLDHRALRRRHPLILLALIDSLLAQLAHTTAPPLDKVGMGLAFPEIHCEGGEQQLGAGIVVRFVRDRAGVARDDERVPLGTRPLLQHGAAGGLTSTRRHGVMAGTWAQSRGGELPLPCGTSLRLNST